MKPRDLTGQRFGSLTALRRIANAPRYKQARWLFACDCGGTTEQFGYSVWNGRVKRCRTCADAKRQAGDYRRTHGLHDTPEYRSWSAMRGRCENENNAAFHFYGGRGIHVCERWAAFENFFADMGARPSPKHSLDRIDTDGPYSPENCRWATDAEQVRNRRLTLMYAYAGQSMPLADWCDRLHLPYRTVWHRYKMGDRGDALFRPIEYGGRRIKGVRHGIAAATPASTSASE